MLIQKLEGLSFTNSSIYSNQNEVDKKHEEFKQVKNAIKIFKKMILFIFFLINKNL